MTQQQTTARIDQIKEWILAKHKNRTDVGADEDLIDSRLVDSLSFVEFVFLIQEVSGVEIDMDTLNISDIRTLAAIEKHFLAT
ncbi:phosphopantetheine-binding protein [Microbispora triticiradicis]|uniref:phosphopantetheine-binding protein n=1 Tax=Microbispora triticiradicis TaxID=2200763 RepID=UPI001AD6EF80|nr:phosphopantetheine-binding protein [Microbispora triticiradicis]MBO4271873.1 acyl carrier protein [Microbispora triticiradicis]